MNHLKISISERQLYFNANVFHFSLLSFHWKKSQQEEKREERRTKREKDKKKKPHFVRLFLFGGGWWIRTTEGVASRFTVCPLWPLGKSPIYEVWSWWTDSNPRPADYKSAALPTELHQHTSSSTADVSLTDGRYLVKENLRAF